LIGEEEVGRVYNPTASGRMIHNISGYIDMGARDKREERERERERERGGRERTVVSS